MSPQQQALGKALGTRARRSANSAGHRTGIIFPEAGAAFRNHPQARARLRLPAEDLRQQRPCPRISRGFNRPGINVVHYCLGARRSASGLSRLPIKISTGSKPVTAQGMLSFPGMKLNASGPITVVTCPGRSRPETLTSPLPKRTCNAAGMVLWTENTEKLLSPSAAANFKATAG